MFFVIHLAQHDWHRTVEEWKARRGPSCAFFGLAVVGDALDVLAHVCVITAGLVELDTHFLHTTEPRLRLEVLWLLKCACGASLRISTRRFTQQGAVM